MIHDYSCTGVRDRLEAFHDGELTVHDRVALQNHLDECSICNHVSNELASIGSTLRDLAGIAAAEEPVERLRISAHVIERLRVEEQFSIRAQIVGWFQDMHLVWAGIGASVATLICVVGSASVLHAANQERPNSMARVIAVLANPGSNDNPLPLNYEMRAPRAVTDAAIEMSEEDVEYALSAVVSREGRVQGVEVINRRPTNSAEVNAMLNEAYRMKFAPATARGDAVAVSMVWLVANTTVKGRHDVDIQVLRQALRLQTTPAPIAPLPIPPDAVAAPTTHTAPLLKPVMPDVSSSAVFALAAGGD
jgi:putative zinc finger protein